MDWNAAIETNREALKRVLAMLLAMAGMGCGLGAGGQFTFFRQKGGGSPEVAQAEKSKLSPELTPALTLPRRLHRAVLGLLRPAEAAVRRLVIMAAHGLALPPLRPRKPRPKDERGRKAGRAGMPVPDDLVRRVPALPLLDPLRPFSAWARRAHPVAARSVPRILGLDFYSPFHPLPPAPSPNDPIDAARLALRLQALGRALDDLPGQARRFARWRARAADAAAQRKQGRDTGAQGKGGGRFRRPWPLKPGRPPGWRRKPVHEVHEVLNAVHGLAFWALEPPDTS